MDNMRKWGANGVQVENPDCMSHVVSYVSAGVSTRTVNVLAQERDNINLSHYEGPKHGRKVLGTTIKEFEALFPDCADIHWDTEEVRKVKGKNIPTNKFQRRGGLSGMYPPQQIGELISHVLRKFGQELLFCLVKQGRINGYFIRSGKNTGNYMEMSPRSIKEQLPIQHPEYRGHFFIGRFVIDLEEFPYSMIK